MAQAVHDMAHEAPTGAKAHDEVSQSLQQGVVRSVQSRLHAYRPCGEVECDKSGEPVASACADAMRSPHFCHFSMAGHLHLIMI